VWIIPSGPKIRSAANSFRFFPLAFSTITAMIIMG
jgi:hypothetical protein